MKICSVEGCDGKHKGRGYCHKHLQRVKRLGTPDLPPVQSVEDRFWARIDRTGDCWLWTASTTTFGYGQVNQYGRGAPNLLAHRVSWQLHFGEIPAGMMVCHKCDVPRCVNPDHLFLGSQRENLDDMRAKCRGRNGTAMGSENQAAKLDEPQAREIKRRLRDGESAAAIAVDYPVGRNAIDWIRVGRTWAHVD